MARLFDDGSSEYLEISQAVESSLPFAIICWFNTNDDIVAQNVFGMADKDVANEVRTLYITAANKIAAYSESAANGASQALTTATWSVNTWHHTCGIWSGIADRRVFLDGANKATNSSSVTVINLDTTAIGRLPGSTPTLYWSGLMAEVAIYDLSAWPGASDSARADNFEKILPSLAAGYSPLFYPLGLVAYWPLIQGNDDDRVGGYNMSPINTPSIGDHPRIIYPVTPQLGFLKTAVAAGGTMTLNTGFWGGV